MRISRRFIHHSGALLGFALTACLGCGGGGGEGEPPVSLAAGFAEAPRAQLAAPEVTADEPVALAAGNTSFASSDA